MDRYEAQRMAAEDAYDAAHKCDCGGLYERVCDVSPEDALHSCSECHMPWPKGGALCGECEGCRAARLLIAGQVHCVTGDVTKSAPSTRPDRRRAFMAAEAAAKSTGVPHAVTWDAGVYRVFPVGFVAWRVS
jgi:hypothetical protein